MGPQVAATTVSMKKLKNGIQTKSNHSIVKRPIIDGRRRFMLKSMKTKETESSWPISIKDPIATTSSRKSLKRLIRTRFRRHSAQMCFMWWSIYLIRKKEKEEYSLIPLVRHQKVITTIIRCQTFRIVRSALLVQKLTQNVSMYRLLVIHQVHRREKTRIRCWEKMIRTLKKWRGE